MDFTAIVGALQSRNDLTDSEMSTAIGQLLSGEVPQNAIVDFLSALHQKGETAIELAGAARALRAAMIPVHSPRRPVLDTCGTGGDGTRTFNISTAAAIVLSATGCLVAKHGNRKITSSTGSADVLAELGINLDAKLEVVECCLAEVGMCFCFAPHFHPAMKHVGPARRQLAHPTIFNRLGPLANPASAELQVIGVGDSRFQDTMAETLQRLGTQRSVVVHGEDGVDEVSLSAPTRVLEVTQQGITEHCWTPELFGVKPANRTELFADDPVSSAACIRQVLEGQAGPCRDVVVINAAAALWLTRPEGTSLADCAEAACQAIDSGRARNVVSQLGRLTCGDQPK
jgi:anthranilate phosphoribosyltransferase